MTTKDKQLIINKFLIELFDNIKPSDRIIIADTRRTLSEFAANKSIGEIAPESIGLAKQYYIAINEFFYYKGIAKKELNLNLVKDYHAVFLHEEIVDKISSIPGIGNFYEEYLFKEYPGCSSGFVPIKLFMQKPIDLVSRKLQL